MAFTEIDEVFRYIESFTDLERSGSGYNARTYRLERMQLLLEHFDNPQLRYRTIHIAGTKGKGSTAALLAASLQAAGRRTGLYTSPHVVSYMERIEVPGMAPALSDLLSLAESIRRAVASLPAEVLSSMGPPNTFELLTLLAFCYFEKIGCDYVVVETGIGGRLDATNLVHPELCLLTPIELEHTDVLGDTLEEIAREKAGIFKPGRPVYSAPQHSSVRAVLRGQAAKLNCPIVFADEMLEEYRATCSPSGTRVTFRLRGREPISYRLSLIGSFQGENAVLVDLAVHERLPFAIGALQEGFAKARLPGRMEVVRRQPPLVLDGAHTPRSAEKVLQTFTDLFGPGGVLLFAAAAGKKIAEMAEILAADFADIVVTAPGSYRSSRPEEAYREFQKRNPATRLQPDTAEALKIALGLAANKRPLLVTGSFYLVGEVRRALAQGGQREADE
jgi:dihydrofolate synthase/folylpolyglutamate synthase